MASEKKDTTIRLLSFNVNGLRTLFHYPPFSTFKNSLPKVFNFFNADIITFQELKIDKYAINKWGKLDNYYSFITIPTSTKGYSGVGCWVKKYPVDHPLYPFLQIVKAEEGITGLLLPTTNKKQTPISNGTETSGKCYRDFPDLCIGGYDGIDDICSRETAMQIDSQGRCIMLEFPNDMVIISTYCPANSSKTQEGELYRIHFLKILFKRIKNLDKMGKKIVLMGDLNICRDIFDSAEALERNFIKIDSQTTINQIMETNSQVAFDFVMNPETPHRRMLNQLLVDSNIPQTANDGILIDSTRYIQGKDRLKLYTVWNTLKNSRPLNYGSRVDFILLSDNVKTKITDANILPDVMGSDHCPLFTDIDTGNDPKPKILKIGIPRFEARYKYNLNNNNILTMFSKSFQNSNSQLNNFSSDTDDTTSHSTSSSPSTTQATPRKRRNTKTANSIDSFFKKSKTATNGDEKLGITEFKSSSTSRGGNPPPQEVGTSKPTIRKQVNTFSIKDVFGKPPHCKHNEEAILRTSRTSENPGRKFWICNRSKGASNDKESSCGFFQWV